MALCHSTGIRSERGKGKKTAPKLTIPIAGFVCFEYWVERFNPEPYLVEFPCENKHFRPIRCFFASAESRRRQRCPGRCACSLNRPTQTSFDGRTPPRGVPPPAAIFGPALHFTPSAITSDVTWHRTGILCTGILFVAWVEARLFFGEKALPRWSISSVELFFVSGTCTSSVDARTCIA